MLELVKEKHCIDCGKVISKWGTRCNSCTRRLTKGKKHVLSPEWRAKLIETMTGENNPLWKGDDVGYSALHDWVWRTKPKPLDGLCQICHVAPLIEAANISREYHRDINDFLWVCKDCHEERDNEYLREIGRWLTPEELVEHNRLKAGKYRYSPKGIEYTKLYIEVRDHADEYNLGDII
jgi:hypothetical protein